MKKTTLLWDCGTQRIFEEGPHPYAFRTQGYGTPEVLAPLLYLLKHKPDFRPWRSSTRIMPGAATAGSCGRPAWMR